MRSEVPHDRGSIARMNGAVAVTAIARNVRHLRITLSPPRTTPMGFVVAGPPQPMQTDDVITRIMLDLAENEAVRMFSGIEPGVPASVVTLVQQLCTECGDERQPDEIVQQCRAQVARLLAANRGMVELLGDVLLREGILEGATVRQIIGDGLVLPDSQ